MTKYCLTDDPIDQTQIYFGFFIFALFFGILIKCNRHHTDMQKQQRKAKQYKDKLLKEKNKKAKFTFNQQLYNEQNIQQKYPEHIDQTLDVRTNQRNNSKVKNILNPEETLKRLSQFAYKYVENEHQMIKIYRSPKQIEQQTDLYINRVQLNPLIPAQKKQQKLEKVNVTNKPGSATKLKKIDSFQNINQAKSKLQKSQPKIPQQKTVITQISNAQNNKKSSLNIFDNIKEQRKQEIQKNKKMQNKEINKTFHGSLFTIKQSKNENENIQAMPKKQLISFPKLNQKSVNPAHNQVNNIKQQSNRKQNEINLSKPNKQVVREKQEKKQSLFPELKNKGQSIKPNEQRKDQNIVQGLAINSPQQYLDTIIKYSKTFGVKTQIKTNINNLGGAKSDPRDIWAFAASYIKTINPRNHDQAQTFSYKIWQAIVHKFIKNTNLKDGFQRMPPKQKNSQAEKNSINTYVVLINIFRVMGHQSVWLGVFGNTLRMLQFIFKRTQPLKKWKELELIQSKYVALDGDVSSKYQSRIDFLLYFLLALTTFDPIQVFQQVSQKTGQNYNFIADLKKYKYKWAYKQFWCLIEVMKKNKLQAYFKIPFWNNTVTVIYLQMLNNLKQGKMKQFMNLSKWIFKQVKSLTQKLMTTEEGKYLIDESQEGPNNKFSFDGQEFMQGTKTLGRIMESRLRELNINKWEQFRDKNSIFYYFWRMDSV